MIKRLVGAPRRLVRSFLATLDSDRLARLIHNCSLVSKAAQAELFERYKRRAYCIALPITKSHHDAEDVVSKAFVKIFRGLAKSVPRKLLPWLDSVVRNTAIDFVRERRRSGIVSFDNLGPVPARDQPRFDLTPEEVTEVLATSMPPKEVQVAERVIQLGCEWGVLKTVAEELSLSARHVCRTWARACAILRQYLRSIS